MGPSYGLGVFCRLFLAGDFVLGKATCIETQEATTWD